MNTLIDELAAAFSEAQQMLFVTLVQPVMFELGLASLLDDGFDATGWLLVGLLQLLVMICVIAPLQRWRPVEAVTDQATVRVDIIYTVIHRLGLFPLALFFTLTPSFDALFGALRVGGWETFHLDAVWPGVSDQPLASLPFTVAYNPALLQVTSVSEGSFLRQGNGTTSFASRVADGQIAISGARAGDTGAQAPGTVATINFRALAASPAGTEVRVLSVSPLAVGGRPLLAGPGPAQEVRVVD